MSTESNSVDALIFCLSSVLSPRTSPSFKEASSESVRAAVREALLEVRIAQFHHTAPGKRGLLVEPTEVPRDRVYVEGYTETPGGLTWKHRLL